MAGLDLLKSGCLPRIHRCVVHSPTCSSPQYHSATGRFFQTEDHKTQSPPLSAERYNNLVQTIAVSVFRGRSSMVQADDCFWESPCNGAHDNGRKQIRMLDIRYLLLLHSI